MDRIIKSLIVWEMASGSGGILIVVYDSREMFKDSFSQSKVVESLEFKLNLDWSPFLWLPLPWHLASNLIKLRIRFTICSVDWWFHLSLFYMTLFIALTAVSGKPRYYPLPQTPHLPQKNMYSVSSWHGGKQRLTMYGPSPHRVLPLANSCMPTAWDMPRWRGGK